MTVSRLQFLHEPVARARWEATSSRPPACAFAEAGYPGRTDRSVRRPASLFPSYPGLFFYYAPICLGARSLRDVGGTANATLPNFRARFSRGNQTFTQACDLHATKRRAIARGLVSARFIDAAIMQRSSGRVLSPLLRAMARWGEAPRVLGWGVTSPSREGCQAPSSSLQVRHLRLDRSSVRPTLSLIHRPPRHFTDLKGDNIDVMLRTGTGKTVTKRLRQRWAGARRLVRPRGPDRRTASDAQAGRGETRGYTASAGSVRGSLPLISPTAFGSRTCWRSR